MYNDVEAVDGETIQPVKRWKRWRRKMIKIARFERPVFLLPLFLAVHPSYGQTIIKNVRLKESLENQ